MDVEAVVAQKNPRSTRAELECGAMGAGVLGLADYFSDADAPSFPIPIPPNLPLHLEHPPPPRLSRRLQSR